MIKNLCVLASLRLSVKSYDEFLSREAVGRRNVFASHRRAASAVRGQSFGRCLKRPPIQAVSNARQRELSGMQSVKKKRQANL